MITEEILKSFLLQLEIITKSFSLVTWQTLLDIVLLSLILWNVYLSIKATRALKILSGLVMVVLLFGFSEVLELTLLNFFLKTLFLFILVGLPIIFQPELRAALERLGRGGIIPGLGPNASNVNKVMIKELAKAIRFLSNRKIGALIVIERHTGLKDLAETGIMLEANLTHELLRAIFEPHSPLHDGAVIIKGKKIIAANVFLPLSDELLDKSMGTRHRAALGITQETDAISLVISEETGQIKAAVRKKFSNLSQAHLEQRLMKMLIKT